jgi:hypothetical protein
MKKFLIAGSSLAAVAAAGSAGAVDVTLGGSIDMGIKYGVGKGADKANGFALTDNYQSISISVAAAGTTDAGLKFGGSFGLSTAEELKFNPYDTATTQAPNSNKKHMFKLVNSSADVKLRGVGYNVSGGGLVKPGSMVSVKINSSWHEAGSTITQYEGQFNSIASTSAVCKLAGEIAGGKAGNVTRGAASSVAVESGIARAGLATANAAGTMTMDTVNGSVNVALAANKSVNVDGNAIAADTVAMGPFMEVMMTSSTTKMVIGGVCVTHKAKKSKTAFYMDVASRVLHVSDASIYIEGGFGKLSVGTGAYGGSVAGIGSAADEVEIKGDLVATLSSVSFMGLNGHGAVALDTVSLAGRPNYSFGTSIDLLGLTFAVEMEDQLQADQADTTANTYIDVWDAATSYDFNGMAVGIATDSDGDWAMSLGYELMGFSMSSIVENVAPGNSKKSGLSIDTSFSTSLNGVGISVALDEDLAMTLGASYTMGNSGLTMYVNYSQADNGGKIGATMSF